MSVNGQDPRSNVYLLDGTLQNDFTNGPAGSAAGTALGTETIREFRVETNAYSAEFGRNSGGQINVLTKSGTNQLHGSAYEFHRNDALDARNYFDARGQARLHAQPVRRHGRRPDRARTAPSSSSATKACASASGARSRRVVPDDNARLGILPSGDGRRSTRPVAPYLDEYPLRQRRRTSARGLARLHLPVRSAARPALRAGPPRPQLRRPRPVLRALHLRRRRRSSCRPTSRSSRARSSRATSSSPASTARCCRPRHASTPRASASAAPASARTSRRTRRSRWRRSCPAGRCMGDIDIGGHAALRTAELGQPAAGAERVRLRRTTSSHTRGRHLLKAGALVERYQDNMVNPTFSLGIYTFPNLQRLPAQRAATLHRPDAGGAVRSLLALHAVRLLRAGRRPAHAAT